MIQKYIVPDANMARLAAEVAALNKRAKKLKTQPIAFDSRVDHVRRRVALTAANGTVGHQYWTDAQWAMTLAAGNRHAAEDTGGRMAWHEVTVTGESPRLNGWAFVATLSPVPLDDGTVENFVRALPGERCPDHFRKDVGRCDHCNAARRRNETFVLRDEATDEYKVVGRQCLKDFLGHNADPHALAGAAELLARLDDLCRGAKAEGWGGGGGEWGWTAETFLSQTAAVIRRDGWLGKTKARDLGRLNDATANVVLHLLTPPPGDRESRRLHQELQDRYAPTDKDREDAVAALDWARDLDVPEDGRDNSYLLNCRLCARAEVVTYKMAGVSASILIAWRKATQPAEVKAGKHLGRVGEPLEAVLTCRRVQSVHGQYGECGLHKFESPDGDVITWFASAGTRWLGEGDIVRCRATVSKHSSFQGRLETTVTRLKVLDRYVAAAG